MEQNNETTPTFSPLSPLVSYETSLEEQLIDSTSEPTQSNTASNKRFKPGKSWVWDHMKKNKLNKKSNVVSGLISTEILNNHTTF